MFTQGARDKRATFREHSGATPQGRFINRVMCVFIQNLLCQLTSEYRIESKFRVLAITTLGDNKIYDIGLIVINEITGNKYILNCYISVGSKNGHVNTYHDCNTIGASVCEVASYICSNFH